MRDDLIERNQLRTRLDAALVSAREPVATPAMVVDLDAFDANADDLERRAGGTPLRVASKSLRFPALLRRALAHDAFSGVLAYSLRAALWLPARMISDAIVMGSPSEIGRAAWREKVCH